MNARSCRLALFSVRRKAAPAKLLTYTWPARLPFAAYPGFPDNYLRHASRAVTLKPSSLPERGGDFLLWNGEGS
jgi:hypothetical protein